MLFNSLSFIFVFLPATFVLSHVLRRASPLAAIVSLLTASLLFYACWKFEFLALLILSIAFNYSAGLAINRLGETRSRRVALSCAIAVDLIVLGVFKYSNFFLGSVTGAFGLVPVSVMLILPLGISFYTFTQIAFLVDVYRARASALNALEYGLFVAYFPHLIAGPILHHAEMIPQFRRPDFSGLNVAMGMSIFSAGLFKKVILADSIGPIADKIFNAASHGTLLDAATAWVGALSYTLQLYFDFSGYSDMAIGLSLLFGIRVPANFNSPYKAISIIDFWRRWHMTLSRFLRDYLYTPLGGNRKGTARRYVNVLVTMVLGGLWHGAGWTFVAWGALHGAYLVINHAWRAIRPNPARLGRIRRASGRLATFVAVVVAWVFFRSADFGTAFSVLAAMIELREPAGPQFLWSLFDLLEVAILLLVVWFTPNTLEIFARYRPAISVYEDSEKTSPASKVRWLPSWGWGALCGVAAAVSLLVIVGSQLSSPFLYFQF